MCRRELDRAETEATRNKAIIADYKQVGVRLQPAGLLENKNKKSADRWSHWPSKHPEVSSCLATVPCRFSKSTSSSLRSMPGNCIAQQWKCIQQNRRLHAVWLAENWHSKCHSCFVCQWRKKEITVLQSHGKHSPYLVCKISNAFGSWLL